MSNFIKFLRDRKWLILGLIIALVALCFLLLFRLGSLTKGVSADEVKTATTIYGWHGIYRNPLYLPINIIRSVFYKIDPQHGQTILRIPNVIFGCLSVISFACLLCVWHGTRTAFFGTILFATGAWTLHVSRMATYDVLYLLSVPTLLLFNTLMHRYYDNIVVYFGTLCIWGMFLYVPGLIWLIILNIFWEREALSKGWQAYSALWQRIAIIVVSIIWIPLIANYLRNLKKIEIWVGHLQNTGSITHSLKLFLAVPFHLFIRGPEYPQIWLGKAPVFDVFVLTMCLLGFFFYISHYQANRSRMLGSYALTAWFLAVFGGPIMFSLMVSLGYVCAAAGIAFLMREWLHVFPTNPLARSLGIGLILLLVTLSSFYNIRSYFIAWPYNPSTQTAFMNYLHT